MYNGYGMGSNMAGYGSTYGQGMGAYGSGSTGGAGAGAGAGGAGMGAGISPYGGAGRGYGGARTGEYGSGGNAPAYGAGAGGAAPRTAGREHEFVEGKLFLGGLPTQTTKDSLIQYCEQWGELSDHVLMEGRGFGFVTFADPACAQSFLELKEHMIDGKRVEAKAAVRSPDGGGQLTKKMFVGGTGEVSDEDFRTYFDQFGYIEDCVVLRRPDGASRGFGFVTYASEISVEKCLVMRHTLNGRPVELKRALSKDRPQQGPPQGGYGSVGGAGGPVRTGKQPDWVCANGDCKNKNFGWRSNCNRCQMGKPLNPELAPAKPGVAGGGGAYVPGGAAYGAARQTYDAAQSASAEPGASQGFGGMGMQGLGAYGMAGYGMGGMGGGLGAAGLGAGLGAGSMGGGLGAGGLGGGLGAGAYGAAGAGYGAAAGNYSNGSEGYGRAGPGRGAGGAANRFRPY